MPNRTQNRLFKPTSLEDILAGRTSDSALSDTDDLPPSGSSQPRVIQVREAGRGFSPEFKGAHNEETRFRLLDGTTDDDPYWLRIVEIIQKLRGARMRIKEREENGLPPNPADVHDLNHNQLGLNEALPNFFRHGK